MLKFIKVLGQGDGGIVYQVRFPLVKQSHALKVLTKASECYSLDKFSPDGIRNEIIVAKRLNHAHLVDCQAVFSDHTHDYILTELCQHGVSDFKILASFSVHVTVS